MDREDHIKSTLRDFNIGYNRQQRRGVDSTRLCREEKKKPGTKMENEIQHIPMYFERLDMQWKEEVDKKDKEIERLKDEKQWLINETVNMYVSPEGRETEKQRLIKKMQQALKDKP